MTQRERGRGIGTVAAMAAAAPDGEPVKVSEKAADSEFFLVLVQRASLTSPTQLLFQLAHPIHDRNKKRQSSPTAWASSRRSAARP